MNYYVDVESEYKQAKSIVLRYSLIFSTVLTLTLVADTLLIVFANEEYVLNYIFAVIITILFSWFAIFFFTTIYQSINAKYRYFKSINSGLKEEAEVEFIAKRGDICRVNGLYVYPIHVRYLLGITEEDKIIYSFSDNWDLEPGEKLTISTYQRIILKADSHS